MAAAPPSSASAAVAPSTAGAAGTGARYSRVLSGAGEAYINLDAYLSDVVAYLQELAGSPEGSTRYLDLASDRGEVGAGTPTHAQRTPCICACMRACIGC